MYVYIYIYIYIYMYAYIYIYIYIYRYINKHTLHHRTDINLYIDWRTVSLHLDFGL